MAQRLYSEKQWQDLQVAHVLRTWPCAQGVVKKKYMVYCPDQVMYAYVMRPETLPKSYWKFIVKSGPVEEPALEAVRRTIRKLPIDLHAFNAFLKKRGSQALLATAFPKQVSCRLYTCTFCHLLACLTDPLLDKFNMQSFLCMPGSTHACNDILLACNKQFWPCSLCRLQQNWP